MPPFRFGGSMGRRIGTCPLRYRSTVGLGHRTQPHLPRTRPGGNDGCAADALVGSGSAVFGSGNPDVPVVLPEQSPGLIIYGDAEVGSFCRWGLARRGKNDAREPAHPGSPGANRVDPPPARRIVSSGGLGPDAVHHDAHLQVHPPRCSTGHRDDAPFGGRSPAIVGPEARLRVSGAAGAMAGIGGCATRFALQRCPPPTGRTLDRWMSGTDSAAFLLQPGEVLPGPLFSVMRPHPVSP